MVREDLFAKAFNAWMDEYINHPELFTKHYENEMQHLKERIDGAEPTYGDRAAATFRYYYERIIHP